MIRPKCRRSEYKDGRHLWHGLCARLVAGSKAEWCSACGMYRINGRTFFAHDLRKINRSAPWLGYEDARLWLSLVATVFAFYQFGVSFGWFPALIKF